MSWRIMAMVRDSGAEKPCSMGDVPPVLLLDRICHRIRVKRYSIRTEQAYCDWIRRLIIFHGKRQPSKRYGRSSAFAMPRLAYGQHFVGIALPPVVGRKDLDLVEAAIAAGVHP
jgi:hypothetical protein